MDDVFMASIKIHAYGHDFLCEGDKVSTPPHESCNNPLHELVERRRTFRSSRLSPWQSERGLDPRGAGTDRTEGTPAGFTFAEAARWAGVSPAAPYRHFRDRDELL